MNNQLVIKLKENTHDLPLILNNLIKNYKVHEICPVCRDKQMIVQVDNIQCSNSHFMVLNNPVRLVMNVENCPVCGKEIG